MALDVLAEDGVEAVRVEALARRLGVTKGSFYWHFLDRAALHEAILTQWRDSRIAVIAEQIAATKGDAKARLHQLFALFLDRRNAKGLAVELAIRHWSRRDDRAAAAVAAVDSARLSHVSALFAASGLSASEAASRAFAFYAFLFGQSLIVQPTAERARRRGCASLLID